VSASFSRHLEYCLISCQSSILGFRTQVFATTMPTTPTSSLPQSWPNPVSKPILRFTMHSPRWTLPLPQPPQLPTMYGHR
jgi:hypothetical protein